MSLPAVASAPTVTLPDAPPVETTKVVVWRSGDGAPASLDAFLRTCRDEGWHVQRSEPRVLEGSTFGALVILEKPVADRERPRRSASPRTQASERTPVLTAPKGSRSQ